MLLTTNSVTRSLFLIVDVNNPSFTGQVSVLLTWRCESKRDAPSTFIVEQASEGLDVATDGTEHLHRGAGGGGLMV